MSATRVTDITDDPALRANLLALGNTHAQETSLLDATQLNKLIERAAIATHIGADAFLIAFDETSAYDGGHFHWFRDRLQRFVYIDRVLVAASARQLGLGRALYLDVFERARRKGRSVITCEVNRTPANPASDAFHARLAFQSAGTGFMHDGAKVVRYLVRHL